MLSPEILFEDNSILVINKPAGLMVEKDRYGHPSAEGWVADYFNGRRLPGNTILGIVHRLDRPVSGVLLFAKKKSVLVDLNHQFEQDQIEKTYFAVVEQAPAPAEGNLQHYLFKDVKQKKAIIYKNNRKHAVKCELIYTTLEKIFRGYLLELHPLTGKYHQIRAQMAFIGCPIVGDQTYGAKTNYEPDAICLHSAALEFMHPVLKKKMKIECPMPGNW